MVFFAWKNKSVLVYQTHGVSAHLSCCGKVWTENKQFTNDPHSRRDDVFSALTERWGTTSHETETFAFALCSPRGRKAWLLVFGMFLKMELFWSPKRELGSVFSLKFWLKGKPAPDGSLNSWLFSLCPGDQEIGDTSYAGARREGNIDWGFVRLQNT